MSRVAHRCARITCVRGGHRRVGSQRPPRWLHQLMVSLTKARILSPAGLSPPPPGAPGTLSPRDPPSPGTTLPSQRDQQPFPCPLPPPGGGTGWLGSPSGRWFSGTCFCGLCSPPHAPRPLLLRGALSLVPHPTQSSQAVRTSLCAATAQGQGASSRCDSRPHPSQLDRHWQVRVLVTEQPARRHPRQPGCAAPGPSCLCLIRGPATPRPVLASPLRPAPATFAPASFLG